MSTLVKLRFDMGSGFAGCSSTIGCAETAAVSLLWLLVWVGGSSLILFAKQANIKAAKEVLAIERQRVENERIALQNFSRRIESVVPTSPPAPEPPGNLLTDGDDSLQRIREAYRDTVMAVDHYEDDYGESLEENLALEFGDDIATAVAGKNGVPPGLPSVLLNQSQQARALRKNYLDTLDEERQRLEVGHRSLSSLGESCDNIDERHLRMVPFTDLQERWQRLSEHRNDLNCIMTQHQQRIREEMSTGFGVPDETSFFDFLYDELDVTFPVLADGMVLRQEIDKLDRRLTSALAGRP